MKAALLACLVAALALASCGDGEERAGTATTKPQPAPTAPATTRPAATPKPPAAPKRSTAANLVVGIGEQHAAMFADRRFRALGIYKARLVVSYDTVGVRFERDLVDTWLAAARRAGAEPFITFGHSRVNPKKLPSVAEFRAAFAAFRRRYPDVLVYAPWNEINHASQPTARAPRRAAQYYNVVKAECAGCTVLAGDVLDQGGMTRYLQRYRRHLDGRPTIWGLHNYADTNRFRSRGLRAMLRAVRGEVWLTETGGIVRFGRGFPQDERRAARAVAYALKLARANERVKRIYLYNWTGSKPTDRFDAGLIAPDGSARPAYDVLREALGR